MKFGQSFLQEIGLQARCQEHTHIHTTHTIITAQVTIIIETKHVFNSVETKHTVTLFR